MKVTIFTVDPRAADGIRTHDLFLTKEVLYQLSYSSKFRLTQAPDSSTDRAGDGNRTHMSCLEGRGFTTKLHPRQLSNISEFTQQIPIGQDRNRTCEGFPRQIYSLVQLTALPPAQ
ncbi:unnamed protein product [Tuwongella immobilis]|uniref:Uncharacterized protein n=1 Tax=Tuwongella immobilis TaxID=692036 RepID=A0A6C2YNM7_9BACT|nr:unnamed protein product [Tuwongella immobilis]VTS01563.1 unnamed protein product [Tuwongella immobilis]